MADWYCSSVDWAALPLWVANTAYTVGQIIRPTAPAFTNHCAYRCTTAGTTAATEAAWTVTNNGLTTQGTAVFTNISGQSAYGWSAAAGNMVIMNNRATVGDRIFLAHTHSETNAGGNLYSFNNNVGAFGLIRVLSVNRSGSVPPVEADLLAGATITYTTASGGISLDGYCNMFYYGVTFAVANGSTQNNVYFNSASSATKSHYLKNCAIVSTVTGTCRIGSGNAARVTFDNTTVRFNTTAHSFGCITNGNSFELHWINTPNAIGGSVFPATLFSTSGSTAVQAVCRGVDLSAITGTLMASPASSQGTKLYLDSCKIHPSVTRYGVPAAAAVSNDEVELVNCWDGTNILNERYGAPGQLTTDRTTYMTAGANDGTPYSFKLASSVRGDKRTVPLDCFWLDTGNTSIGSSKTATVEIVSSASLNNDDISLLLEYMGTSSSTVASIATTLPGILTTVSALPTSSATWTLGGYTFWNDADRTAGITLSANALVVTTTSAGNTGIRGYTSYNSGKVYWEYIVSAGASDWYGIALSTADLTTTATTVGKATVTRVNGNISINNVATGSTLGARSTGDVLGVAIDFAAQLIWFRVAPSGNWNGSSSANPATGAGGLSISALSGSLFPLYQTSGSGVTFTTNFGASTFTGSVPSGFTSGLLLSTASNKIQQKLQTTFTPQTAGRVRGLVKLGKINTTCWVNPRITVATYVESLHYAMLDGVFVNPDNTSRQANVNGIMVNL